MHERELTGLHAVVTGASSGIGRAIAIELARAGADVLAHARRSQTALDETAAACASHGVRAMTSLADLGEPTGRAALLDATRAVFDVPDIWIHNAGADVLTGEAASLSFEAKLELLWRVDVEATIALCRAIGARMRDRKSGVILTMGWDQAESGMEGESGELFAATKGAVMAFTRSLALSLAPAVRVNCLAPGWIRTAWGEDAPDAWQRRAVAEAPLGRWGTPEDVAGTARFLVSPAAAFITGQIVRINGGAVR